MKTVLAIIFASFTILSFGQLNQYDSTNRKNGKWIVYWDENWKEVKDSSKAKYTRYTLYNNGKETYSMGPCGRKGWKLEGNTSVKMLDGTYKWYDDKGRLSSEHVFKNGEYLDCKEYKTSTGKLDQHWAFSQLYRGWPNTFALYQYKDDGTVKYFAYYNDKTMGWNLMEVGKSDLERKD